MIYIYKSCVGDLFVSSEPIKEEFLRCRICGDWDELIYSGPEDDYMSFINSIDIAVENLDGYSCCYIMDFINETFQTHFTDTEFYQLVTQTARYLSRKEEHTDY